jgi:hypothetical protein
MIKGIDHIGIAVPNIDEMLNTREQNILKSSKYHPLSP